jgi:hypothetical protein
LRRSRFSICKVLVEERVHTREPRANVSERAPDSRAKRQRHDQDQRDHGERDREQLRVQVRHRDHDPDQRDQVPERGHHAGGEQLVEHVHVVRDARHQPADRIAVEVGERQPLQVAEQPHAQVEHDVLADALHDLVLEIAEAEAHQQHRQVHDRHVVEEREIAVADPVVDRLLREVGSREPDEGIEHDDHDRDDHVDAVRPEVGEQPPHQAVIVGATLGFLVVRHDAWSSSSSCCSRYSRA